MCIFSDFLLQNNLKLPDLPLSNFRVRIVNTETLGGSLLSTDNGIYRNERPELDVGAHETKFTMYLGM